MLKQSNWISSPSNFHCPVFQKQFFLAEKPVSATLCVTALGVYKALLNNKRVGSYHLAPGWTVYHKRVQVQEYNVTSMLDKGNNLLSVMVAGGWYSGRIARNRIPADPRPALIASLRIMLPDGQTVTVFTDSSWSVRDSKTRFADHYDGETYDATFDCFAETPAVVRDISKKLLIPQQGEQIVEKAVLFPSRILKAPNGKTILDFGQEITGVVRITTWAPRGTKILLNCAEMLDSEGNFYNENYRSAKSEIIYICGGEKETWQPEFTFYGFRYIQVTGVDVSLCDFQAIVLASDLKRVGYLKSGSNILNRLFENITWGQLGNFLDIPTDCPQRDERLGWTGDAQVFVNTACWQFDVKRFFTKWLADMMINQREGGAIPDIVPDIGEPLDRREIHSSSAWGDAATICPWTIYLHYGDKDLLRTHFSMMKKWICFISEHTEVKDLWIGYAHPRKHFGDWLGLDAPKGSYTGSSDPDFIASAFYYYSTCLVLQSGLALGEDVQEYLDLSSRILKNFQKRFPVCNTQTECALSLHFGLAKNKKKTAQKLISLVQKNNYSLTTGFVGTPYLLYALSEAGRTDIAYRLLLREDYPSWLYSVKQGATTIWEHWDGKDENGSFWSKDMNSFNHYAYGAVASWVYEIAAGITSQEPGFSSLRIAPQPDKRLKWLSVKHETMHGIISVFWAWENNRFRYEIETPVPTQIVINGKQYQVEPGFYLFG